MPKVKRANVQQERKRLLTSAWKHADKAVEAMVKFNDACPTIKEEDRFAIITLTLETALTAYSIAKLYEYVFGQMTEEMLHEYAIEEENDKDTDTVDA